MLIRRLLILSIILFLIIVLCAGCSTKKTALATHTDVNIHLKSSASASAKNSEVLAGLNEAQKRIASFNRSMDVKPVDGMFSPVASNAFAEIDKKIAASHEQWKDYRKELRNSNRLQDMEEKQVIVKVPTSTPEIKDSHYVDIQPIRKKYSTEWLNAYLRVQHLESRLKDATDLDKKVIAESLQKSKNELEAIEVARDKELREFYASQQEIEIKVANAEAGNIEPRNLATENRETVIKDTRRELARIKLNSNETNKKINVESGHGKILIDPEALKAYRVNTGSAERSITEAVSKLKHKSL